MTETGNVPLPRLRTLRMSNVSAAEILDFREKYSTPLNADIRLSPSLEEEVEVDYNPPNDVRMEFPINSWEIENGGKVSDVSIPLIKVTGGQSADKDTTRAVSSGEQPAVLLDGEKAAAQKMLRKWAFT